VQVNFLLPDELHSCSEVSIIKRQLN